MTSDEKLAMIKAVLDDYVAKTPNIPEIGKSYEQSFSELGRRAREAVHKISLIFKAE